MSRRALPTEGRASPAAALRHIKPQVRDLRAYTLSAHHAPVKLNQNENPMGAPEEFKQRVLERAARLSWERYPDCEPTSLLERLADHAGWRPDGVLAGNGSNELIEAVLRVTVGPGTPVLIPEPTFSLYPLLTQILGGDAIRVGLAADLQYDVEALRRARRARDVPVTIVCTPNNPTGSVLPPEDVAALCGDGDGLVIVDEAYHEFSGRSVVPLLEAHPNLIVLRTFSKALGLAGLRIGYLLAAPALVAEVNKARLPYNLNLISQEAALAVLDAPELVKQQVARIVAERERLLRALGQMPGVHPWPSGANFVLFALEQISPKTVFESLVAHGVLIRDVSSARGLARCLRVSVGLPEENARFLEALREALDEARRS